LDLRVQYDGQAAAPIVTKTYEPTTLDSTDGRRTVTYAVFKAFANRSTLPSPYMCCAQVIDGVPRTEAEDGSIGEPIRKGMIVECRLSVENVGTGDMHWVPIRIRHDKSQPNDIRVYTDLVNTVINEPITLDHLAVKGGGRGGSTLVLVNKINRDISNRIISEEISMGLPGTDEVRLLDLGCGTLKSGTAWTELAEKRQVSVLGVDVIDVGQANINLRGYMKKFKSKFSAEFVHGNFNTDLTTQPQTGRFLITPDRFNAVTCTFAIHYSMATEDSFRTFVKNVSRNLEIGGVFVGAYMNKGLILADMFKKKANKLTGSTGKTQLWQIQLVDKVEEAEAKTFGSAIKVSFTELYQNNVEYLINLEDPTVKRILLEAGLKLKKHQPFNSYEEAERLTVDLERQWLSYHYMFVFEKVTPVAPAQTPTPAAEASAASKVRKPRPAAAAAKKTTSESSTSTSVSSSPSVASVSSSPSVVSVSSSPSVASVSSSPSVASVSSSPSVASTSTQAPTAAASQPSTASTASTRVKITMKPRQKVQE
jgi:SAM-dependent methyltransferase